MPLEQRVIAPIYVSRGCFNLDPAHHGAGGAQHPSQINLNIPNELECVTNGTLANIIRQLSTLSRYAEDLFGNLLEDTSTLVQRSVSLKSRLDVLSERVERLDASSDGASGGPPGATGTISRKPFRSRADNFDQQVVARTTIPLSLREVYERCDQPPPLDKLNPFRDDNMNGLKLYTNPNYFFELWRKEMLADRSRNKVAKKGENAHLSASGGGKSKRNKSASILRHQNSINSELNSSTTASPHHHAAIAHAQQQHYNMTSRGSISSNEIPPGYPGPPGPVYNENGVLQSGQQQVAYAHAQAQAQQQQQQQKIYGQTGQIYGYAGGGAHQEATLVAMKRDEPNPSGVGYHTVIEGYTVDPNNYQHHYVQHHNQQYPPGGQQGMGQSRPNSLELSHQQQQQAQQQGGYGGPPPPPPPNQMVDYYQQQQQAYAAQQQQQNRGSYPSGNGGSIYGTSGQYPSPNSANQMTPTRRAAQLSRPSAPPPAPPGGSGPNSAANSAPSTPKKLNGGGDMMMMAVSGHPQLVSRDSLPPPPPPPNGSMGVQHQHHQQHPQYSSHPHDTEAVLPPPPPPPPPPMPNSGGVGGITNGTQNSDVCSPPPPPPPPMNGLMNSSSSAQFAKAGNSTTTTPSNSTTPNGGTTGKPTADMLIAQAGKLRPTTQQQNNNSNGNGNGGDHVDARSNLLAAIRHGIKLKRVENENREVEKSVPLHDVASILARRVAMELSDSEGEAEEDASDSDAWDDESEC